MNVDELQNQVRKGSRPKYLFFWGHTPKVGAATDKSCLSQWFSAPFEIEGQQFSTAEHYMMAAKAQLFGDDEHYRAVLSAPHPGAAKKIGREVRNFDETTWMQHRARVVVEANQAKFGQNPHLRRFLLGTKDRVLVEASPTDCVWGIGFAADDVRAQDPLQWRGLNLLGFSLMAVRSSLLEEQEAE